MPDREGEKFSCLQKLDGLISWWRQRARDLSRSRTITEGRKRNRVNSTQLLSHDNPLRKSAEKWWMCCVSWINHFPPGLKSDPDIRVKARRRLVHRQHHRLNRHQFYCTYCEALLTTYLPRCILGPPCRRSCRRPSPGWTGASGAGACRRHRGRTSRRAQGRLTRIAASWNEEIQIVLSQIQLYMECTTLDICINLASLCLTLLK